MVGVFIVDNELKVSVSAEALRKVLAGIMSGVGIRELMATRSLEGFVGFGENPINQLIREYNEWADAENKKRENEQSS
ncbi:hypothetical protein [Pectobacterium phage Wc4-1]|uniref:Uncharacterized protein n=1 Tax=Pectobacterium phage Wc4 TaxID=2652428 RepID=A0A5P8D483_9CAUD|nr:hypothetical protein [Pectobacterium phage Wc4]QFP93939.1 hypothetical protein [Pectobacterium phage Wc4-1]